MSKHPLEEVFEQDRDLGGGGPKVLDSPTSKGLVFRCIYDIVHSFRGETFHLHRVQDDSEGENIGFFSIEREILDADLWGTVEF